MSNFWFEIVMHNILIAKVKAGLEVTLPYWIIAFYALQRKF